MAHPSIPVGEMAVFYDAQLPNNRVNWARIIQHSHGHVEGEISHANGLYKKWFALGGKERIEKYDAGKHNCVTLKGTKGTIKDIKAMSPGQFPIALVDFNDNQSLLGLYLHEIEADFTLSPSQTIPGGFRGGGFRG